MTSVMAFEKGLQRKNIRLTFPYEKRSKPQASTNPKTATGHLPPSLPLQAGQLPSGGQQFAYHLLILRLGIDAQHRLGPRPYPSRPVNCRPAANSSRTIS